MVGWLMKDLECTIAECQPPVVYPWLIQGMMGRVPGIEVTVDRAVAIERLEPFHCSWRTALTGKGWPFVRAEQVHGAMIRTVGARPDPEPAAGADGLMTNVPGLCLGLYVADCCAI
jgi:polyphenol oxidase